MARTDAFTGLTEFMAVAEQGSFRAAAAQLRVTPAAISQAIRALEIRLGLSLFLRTTRSVALTEAGAGLNRRLRPAAREVDQALEAVAALQGRPTGTLRLSVPRIALSLVVYRVLPTFRAAFSDVHVEIDVDDESVDLGANGFDAGIRIGSIVDRDMVAVPLTPDFRWCVVGSPEYFGAHGVPRSPDELHRHQCIGYRFPTAKNVARWQFQRKGKVVTFDVAGSVIVNDHLSMIALATAGVGLAYTAEIIAESELVNGSLKRVLQSFCRASTGLCLYFPRRSQTQPKLRAFIDTCREVLTTTG